VRTKAEIKTKLHEKQVLLSNMKESLSAELTETEVSTHPAVLAQQFFVNALTWVLEGEPEVTL
jgi:hypothetical protein